MMQIPGALSPVENGVKYVRVSRQESRERQRGFGPGANRVVKMAYFLTCSRTADSGLDYCSLPSMSTNRL